MNNLNNMRKNITIIAAMVLVVLLFALGFVFITMNNVKQLQTSIDHEAGKELVMDAKDYFDVDEEVLAEITIDTTKVDVNTVGEYEALANINNKEYTIKVNVVDTTAPKAEFKNRYVFTNDMTKIDIAGMLKEVKDVSAYTTKLCRYEYEKALEILSDSDLEKLDKNASAILDASRVNTIGTEEVPTKAGIYKGVVEIADACGNASYEEVYVIFDTTGAKIEDTEDKVVTVSKDKLDKEPSIDKYWYYIKDNVDGKVSADNFDCKLELKDKKAHEWYVHVSYTDRAGNESKADFLVTVKAEAEKTQTSQNETTNTSDKDTGKTNTDKTTDKDNTSDKKDTSKKEETKKEDKKESVADDAYEALTDNQKKAVDAGYGKVVKINDDKYMVLMKGPDHKINGKDGSDILHEYLEKKGLDCRNLGAGWIGTSEDDEWYLYIASNIYKPLTEDDEEFWN